MKQAELLGKLLPGHPDILPIIENIREKYNIPEVTPDDGFTEILLSNTDFNWDAIREDIETQVQNIQLLDSPEAKYIQTLRNL